LPQTIMWANEDQHKPSEVEQAHSRSGVADGLRSNEPVSRSR